MPRGLSTRELRGMTTLALVAGVVSVLLKTVTLLFIGWRWDMILIGIDLWIITWSGISMWRFRRIHYHSGDYEVPLCQVVYDNMRFLWLHYFIIYRGHTFSNQVSKVSCPLCLKQLRKSSRFGRLR